jgi:extradiol dioxygenase family protein
MALTPFHVAVAVHDLDAARAFYTGLLNCPEGRSDARWIDFNLFGHQLVCHLVEARSHPPARNLVDGESVPVPHYGVVLDWKSWQTLAEKLQREHADFLLAPGIRFAGQPGEQGTFFIADPSGNVLEFKSMRHPDNLFATEAVSS